MKTIGKKSLSTILLKVISIIWYLEWIGLFGLIAVGTVTATVRKGFALQLPVEYTSITIRTLSPNLDKLDQKGILNSTNGVLSLHVSATWENCLLLLAGGIAIFTAIAIVTYQLKLTFRNLSRNVTFAKANILYVKRIAFVMVAVNVVQWVHNILTTNYLNSVFKWNNMELGYDFNAGFILTGIALLVVTGIFEMGITLEEEHELTI